MHITTIEEILKELEEMIDVEMIDVDIDEVDCLKIKAE